MFAHAGNGDVATYSVNKQKEERPPDFMPYLFDFKSLFQRFEHFSTSATILSSQLASAAGFFNRFFRGCGKFSGFNGKCNF